MKSNRRRAREGGTSLIEVLVSLMVLALLMVGVLEMFSLSLLVSVGSASRTQLTFKAQQVVENLRFAQQVFRTTGSYPPGSLATLKAGTFPLPYFSGDTAPANGETWAYWGPSGANVLEQDKGPYKVSYDVQDGGSSWVVTVSALPAPPAAGAKAFLGAPSRSKRIDYVAQIPK